MTAGDRRAQDSGTSRGHGRGTLGLLSSWIWVEAAGAVSAVSVTLTRSYTEGAAAQTRERLRMLRDSALSSVKVLNAFSKCEAARGGERLLGEVVAVDVVGLLAGVELHPGDLALATVCFLDRRIPDAQRRPGDVGADAVALEVTQDRMVGDDERVVLVSDFLASLR